jgi:hypothetical protein
LAGFQLSLIGRFSGVPRGLGDNHLCGVNLPAKRRMLRAYDKLAAQLGIDEMSSEPADQSTVGEGILFAIAATFVIGILGIAIGTSGSSAGAFLLSAVFVCGVTQFLYLGPLAFWLHSKRKSKAVKGVLIFAAIVFLLNATCWGVVMGLR